MNDEVLKKGYLTDDAGNPSSIRIMSFASLAIAAFIAIVPMVAPLFGLSVTESDHVWVFIIGAFAPKVFQKFAEKEIPRLRLQSLQNPNQPNRTERINSHCKCN